MDARELQGILAWASLPFVGERALQALIDRAREERRTLADLWDTPLDELCAWVRLHPKAQAALRDDAASHWDRARVEAEAVRAWGVDLLVLGAPDCPPALADTPRRWPLLFAYGALGLLEEPRAAVVSSSQVSPAGLEATDALADALARRDVPLITSTNRAAYQAAATAAKRHAGPSVLVLDRGIAEAFPSGISREPVATARVWDAAFDPDLQLLLSPFSWSARWGPSSGPRRDALIFDLASAVVAVDVRAGGVIDRECREALERGKRVLALDRGPETPDGTRALWEEAGAARLPWSGGDAAAEAVLRALPGGPPGEGAGRARSGWQREIAQFLVRASAAAGGKTNGAIAAFPASGPMAEVAASWSGPGADSTRGAGCLLADLAFSGTHRSERPEQLLERVARGGILAAVLPEAWLAAPEFAAARERWLRAASLRLAVRLPQPAAGEDGAAPAAAVLLKRDARSSATAPSFTPGQDRMGRFHLRRYLLEVLAALGSQSRSR